ncbi:MULTISPECIES: pyridoxal-phosphate dependent enzyme [Pseudomonas]|jgi:L-serine/L-threonine ammonia-lyase|uniref:L-serine ammonia-lyase n=2 Tax=Gammaproteobacteria TaxID=1236 RepID=A0ABD4YE85_9PSED|nr:MULTISPECIES: pyridoxal-phosphate dependent enzyme [Pseudomonas]MBR7519690.1 pyridoxal-phosphate dependent enzyme [Pseudomonas juntendi]MBS6035907.1 pyridoxal-phosphate dependent enzyme [Pseudomonas sp.]MDH0757771.1 pyridoxal-phosphate dependent enzyme [Pseudomonas juntendi]MDH1920602.1 pyridoxal-phosphate dependent enzyme [Pseudomonas juntendi]MDH2013996.1 pyridoxal-phosphate dependent enzyme [Pseudomonas juntendi]
MTLHIPTPLIESRPLSLAAGRNIWLKLDALQPCGSFKLRGVGHACEVHYARGARHLVSSSGGNAGLAVAYAGRKLGVPVTVVVPETTTERAKELLRLENAKVLVHGSSWQEANELALTLVGAGDAFIHPFDDPLLWAGHASLVDEVVATGFKPDAVVLSVGGGGLLSGVVEGLQRNGWADVPVLAVETTGAASLHAAMQAGHTVALPRIASIAGSLGAKRVAEQALACTRRQPVHSHLVSDRAALQACERFLQDHRLLVEPACGAALALAYDASAMARYPNVLVVVCGGATATLEQIQAWLRQVD